MASSAKQRGFPAAVGLEPQRIRLEPDLGVGPADRAGVVHNLRIRSGLRISIINVVPAAVHVRCNLARLSGA